MSDTETDTQQADPQPAARESKRRPAVDLDRMTVQELTALRDAAEAKRLEKLEGAKNDVLAETREKLAQLGRDLRLSQHTTPGNHSVFPVAPFLKGWRRAASG